MSEETKYKIGQKNKGRKPWSTGRKIIHTKENIKKLKDRFAKKCIHVESKIEFESLKDLCKYFNIKRTTQVEARKHNRKSLVFRYL